MLKKRIINLAMAVLMVGMVSSCSLNINNKPSSEGMSLLGSSLEYSYNEGSYSKLKEKLDRLDTLKNEEGHLDEINDILLDFKRYLLEIITYSRMDNLKNSISQNDLDSNNSNRLMHHARELLAWQTEFYKSLIDTPYQEEFFPGKSKEEILKELDDTMPAEATKIENEVEELLIGYRRLKEKEKVEKAPELYSTIVNKYNELARIMGYTNYLEYAYPNIYSRDYKPIDVKSFQENVKKYVVPELEEAVNQVESMQSRLNKTEYSKVGELVRNPFYSSRKLLDSYAKYVGGSYYLEWNELFNGGYYYFSNDSKAMSGAYTTYLPAASKPAVYFGPGYHDIMTVTHEFGHYFAFTENDGWSGSFDLAETQSQGNELIFISYIESESSFVNSISTSFKEYKVSEYLKTIVLATMVDEFEQYVYENNVTDPNRYDVIFKDIASEYGGYEHLKSLYGFELTDYWKRVALDNAGYYISYAVSLIPSLELYSEASKDLRGALDMLMSIDNYVVSEDDYLKTLKNAGLSNPFKEEAFLEINKLIS